jgi:putative oxidoreductase
MFPLYFLYDMWPVLILRLALGIIFLAHGWPKLRDLRANAKNFDAMGFKPGKLFGTVAALLEFFGGLALILGLFTTVVAGLLALQFIVIILWKWAKKIPLKGTNGWELDLIILAALIALFSLGGGAFSLDRIWFGLL